MKELKLNQKQLGAKIHLIIQRHFRLEKGQPCKLCLVAFNIRRMQHKLNVESLGTILNRNKLNFWLGKVPEKEGTILRNKVDTGNGKCHSILDVQSLGTRRNMGARSIEVFDFRFLLSDFSVLLLSNFSLI